jgi:TetR/AcrR family tetracycline transcriptional repressor
MATTVLADNIGEQDPSSEDGTWPEWAAMYGKATRQMLLRYRDGAKMFSGTYLTDSTMYAPMESALRKFTDAGFSLRDAISGLSTIYYYAVGFTIEEQAVYPRPGELNEQYDLTRRAERIDAAKFPLALAAGELALAGFDERFELGLQVIIRGLMWRVGS